jgi:hypothetical protein
MRALNIDGLLPGEDRTAGGELVVDMIPSSSWFRNVRAAIAPKDWNILRRHVYARAKFQCELCGEAARLDAHERFTYDEEKAIQRLVRIIAVCRPCHSTTHIGFALSNGFGEAAASHLGAIRGWTDRDVEYHVNTAFDCWKKRSQIRWKVDLAIIEAAGFTLRTLV